MRVHQFEGQASARTSEHCRTATADWWLSKNFVTGVTRPSNTHTPFSTATQFKVIYVTHEYNEMSDSKVWPTILFPVGKKLFPGDSAARTFVLPPLRLSYAKAIRLDPELGRQTACH